MSHNGLGTPGEGMRIGEALGLRHDDLAIAERQVTVVAAAQRQPGPREGRPARAPSRRARS